MAVLRRIAIVAAGLVAVLVGVLGALLLTGAVATSLIAARVAKEAVNRAYETTLREGLLFERRSFHSLFATEDQKEGMSAFLEKREAQFRDR